MDRSKFKMRYFLGLVMHPITLIPVIAGLTAAGLTAALGKPLAWLYGVGGAVLSLGFLMSRAILKGDEIATQALEEVEREAKQQWNSMLDELDEQLSADDDPRDENLLRSLRELFIVITDDKSWRDMFDSTTVSKLRSALDETFDGSIAKLRKALQYKQQADAADNNKVRSLLLDDRDRLLAEVDRGVTELESVFNDLRGVRNEKADPNNCITRLKQTLEIGKRVRESMESRGLRLDD